MAEKAAHVISTSHPRPSVFEVIAQESLNATLHPALHKIINFLVYCQPEKFGWLEQCCDEIYLMLTAFIQEYYLRKHDASFSEFFYGLKRVSINTDSNKISMHERNLSIIVLVVIPYLRIKIEQKCSAYRLELADGIQMNKWEQRVKQCVCWLQMLTQLFWQGYSTLYLLQYMSGKGECQSPSLYLCGLKLTYGNLDSRPSMWNVLITYPLSLTNLTSNFLSNTMAGCLEMGAFFMQFLHSWQADEKHRDITALPTPPPPQADGRSESYRGICPVCMQKWSIPTAVSVSGYVYCYKCITHHLNRESSTCPVTHLPANSSHLIRLYTI